jgi:polysaccharide export outer membrane protein
MFLGWSTEVKARILNENFDRLFSSDAGEPNMYRGLAFFLMLLLAACGGGMPVNESLPRGAAAYTLMPPAGPDRSLADYKISPLDSIDVSVFGEPDLSVKAVQVDAAGRVALPLVGTVPASGKTATQLAQLLQGKFGEKYLRNPQVTVTVASSVSQKVSIQGEVTEPGVYDLKGPTTLLEALSMAKGELRTAKLDEIVVFRSVGGKRMGAVFDVGAIRAGSANDPQILGSDVVVVGFSQARRTWEDVLKTVPVLGVFRFIP